MWLVSGILMAMALVAVHNAPAAQIEAGSLAQKIFYFHVSSAWAAFLAFLVAAGYGLGHLIAETAGESARRRAARCFASIEVGFVFCTYVLLSGPIWARPVWGVWWRWEPRLTTFLILWATYAACLLMRASIERPVLRDRTVSVYAIIAAIQIPIVYASVVFWRPEAQFHPDRIRLAGEFLRPLWISMAALTALYGALWNLRTRICVMEERAS